MYEKKIADYVIFLLLLIRVRATHIELLESHSNIFETIGTYGPKDIAPNISMPVKGNASSRNLPRSLARRHSVSLTI